MDRSFSWGSDNNGEDHEDFYGSDGGSSNGGDKQALLYVITKYAPWKDTYPDPATKENKQPNQAWNQQLKEELD